MAQATSLSAWLFLGVRGRPWPCRAAEPQTEACRLAGLKKSEPRDEVSPQLRNGRAVPNSVYRLSPNHWLILEEHATEAGAELPADDNGPEVSAAVPTRFHALRGT